MSLSARLIIICMLAAQLLVPMANAAPGNLDATFAAGGAGANGPVNAVALQGDGKILIGGSFTQVGTTARNNLARLNADGSVDLTFPPSSGTFGTVGAVHCIAVQRDGKIVIGGAFTNVNGISRNHLARLNTDGTLDAPFDNNISSVINCMALQTDGKIIIGGAGLIRRLTSTSSPDNTFSATVTGSVSCVAIQEDGSGRILIGGSFTQVGTSARNNIARLSSAGAVDVDFLGRVSGGPPVGTDGEVKAVVVERSGDILIGGSFTLVRAVEQGSGPGDWTRTFIARLEPNGGMLDPSFNPQVGDSIQSMMVQADGKIFIGGAFTSVNGQGFGRLARLATDGFVDSGFPFSVANGANGTVNTVAVQADGKVLIGGEFTQIGGTTRNHVARLANDVPTDSLSVSGAGPSQVQWMRSGAGPEVSQVTFELKKDGDSSWLQLGLATSISGGWQWNGSLPNGYNSGHVRARGRMANGVSTGMIELVRPYPAVDPNFAPPFLSGTSYAMAVQPDGKIIIGRGSNIVRLNADGSPYPTSFAGQNVNGNVNCVAVQSDGKIIIGGTFTTVSNENRRGLARLNADGSLDTGFKPALDATGNSHVRCVYVVPNGQILVGGDFTIRNGASRGVARLNADGSLESTTTFDLGAGVSGTVNCIATQAGGKILIGGTFSIGSAGDSRPNLARLNSNGTQDLPFAPAGANNTVNALTLQADGKILVGGSFANISGAARNRIARLNTDGTIDTGFNPNSNSNANSTVFGLGVQTDGKVLIGGSFFTIGGTTRNGIARINADGTLDSGLSPNPSGTVSGMAIQADGKVLIGGAFSLSGGPSNFARLMNDAASQTLSKPDNTQVQWLRSGAGAELSEVSFDVNAGGGSGWTHLGAGTRMSGGWQVTGLSLPASGYIRALGRTTGGQYCGSAGLIEQVLTFGSPENAPLATTLSAEVDPAQGYNRTATLHGVVYALGTDTSLIFEYGTSTGYGSTLSARPSQATGFNMSAVTEQLSNWTPNTIYHYRIKATNTNGTTVGNDVTFATPGNIATLANMTLENTEIFPPFVPNSSYPYYSSVVSSTTASVNVTATPTDTDAKLEIHGSVLPSGTTTANVPLIPGLNTIYVKVTAEDGVRTETYYINVTRRARIASQVAQMIVFSAPLKLYLAESPFTLSASSSSGLTVFYTVISGPASVSGNVLTLTGTGTVKVRASQAGNAEFLAASPVERTITVAANPTTLTLTNLSQTYTGTPRPINVLGATGEVNVTYKVGLNYVSTPPINVGSYLVKVVAGAVTKTGSLVITKAPLFVQPDDQRKITGQVNPVLTFGYSGFLGSDIAANSVSKAPVIATTATATSVGGLYPITASGGTSANYLFVYQKGTMKVETFAASYEALLVNAGTQRPTAKLELTVPATGKTFTAKLTTPTETAAVSLPGTLTTNPLTETATGTATVKKGANTYLVNVTLPLTGDFTAETELNGTTLGTATNGKKLLTLATGQTLSYIGAHSALLAPATVGIGVPAGAGWAVATIDAKGLLKLAGKLADGTTLTASLAADVSSNPGYRLFIQPYTPVRTGAFIAGDFALKPHPDVAGRRYVAYEDATDLTWVKTSRALDTSYRAGFGPVNTRFTLDPWLPPAAAKVGVPAITLTQRLGLTAPQFTAQHSTISSASYDDLAKTLGLNAATNVVSVIAPVTTPANITKWKVTITPTTGAFVGSFVLTDAGKARTVPFTGIMRQPPSTDLSGLIGDGNFQLPALSPAPNNEILSGEIGFEK